MVRLYLVLRVACVGGEGWKWNPWKIQPRTRYLFEDLASVCWIISHIKVFTRPTGLPHSKRVYFFHSSRSSAGNFLRQNLVRQLRASTERLALTDSTSRLQRVGHGRGAGDTGLTGQVASPTRFQVFILAPASKAKSSDYVVEVGNNYGRSISGSEGGNIYRTSTAMYTRAHNNIFSTRHLVMLRTARCFASHDGTSTTSQARMFSMTRHRHDTAIHTGIC